MLIGNAVMSQLLLFTRNSFSQRSFPRLRLLTRLLSSLQERVEIPSASFSLLLCAKSLIFFPLNLTVLGTKLSPPHGISKYSAAKLHSQLFPFNLS